MSNLSVEDIIDFVEENDVKFIRLAFCDLYGTQKKYINNATGVETRL